MRLIRLAARVLAYPFTASVKWGRKPFKAYGSPHH